MEQDYIDKKLDAKIIEINNNENVYDIGTVINVKDFIIEVTGMDNVMFYEKINIANKAMGYVNSINEDSITVALLKLEDSINVGDIVYSTNTLYMGAYSPSSIGRVIDLFGEDKLSSKKFGDLHDVPIERKTIPIMDRGTVKRPLLTGITGIDLMYPIGKGQRQLIIGDKRTGKTQLGLDTIVNQKNKNVLCFYVAIGKTKKEVKNIYFELAKRGALDYTTIITAFNDELPPVISLIPYFSLSVAEDYMMQGYDVLVVIDDLKRHAEAYREISLISGKTPGRDAYPADIFYTHSRLLEKGCQHKNGGSVTILPIVETKGGDITDYISTNIISITDGQIVLSAKSFQKGEKPAINYGLSVSRLGGAVQEPSMKAVGSVVRRKLLSYLETRSVYELVNMDEMSSELKNQFMEGKFILSNLIQYKFAPKSPTEMITLFEGILEENTNSSKASTDDTENKDNENNSNNNNSNDSSISSENDNISSEEVNVTDNTLDASNENSLVNNGEITVSDSTNELQTMVEVPPLEGNIENQISEDSSANENYNTMMTTFDDSSNEMQPVDNVMMPIDNIEIPVVDQVNDLSIDGDVPQIIETTTPSDISTFDDSNLEQININPISVNSIELDGTQNPLDENQSTIMDDSYSNDYGVESPQSSVITEEKFGDDGFTPPVELPQMLENIEGDVEDNNSLIDYSTDEYSMEVPEIVGNIESDVQDNFTPITDSTDEINSTYSLEEPVMIQDIGFGNNIGSVSLGDYESTEVEPIAPVEEQETVTDVEDYNTEVTDSIETPEMIGDVEITDDSTSLNYESTEVEPIAPVEEQEIVTDVEDYNTEVTDSIETPEMVGDVEITDDSTSLNYESTEVEPIAPVEEQEIVTDEEDYNTEVADSVEIPEVTDISAWDNGINLDLDDDDENDYDYEYDLDDDGEDLI